MSDVFQGPGSWMASDGKWYAAEHHPDEAYRQRYAAPTAPAPLPEPVVELVDTPQVSEPAVTVSEPAVAEADAMAVLRPEAEHSVVDETQAQVEQVLAREALTQHDHQATHPVPAAIHETAEHTIPPTVTSAMPQAYAAETAEMSSAQLKAEMDAVAEQRAAMAEPVTEPVAVRPVDPVQPNPEPNEVVERPRAEPQTFSVASTSFTSPPKPERTEFPDSRPPSVVEAPPRQSVGRTEVEIEPRGEVAEKPKLTVAPPIEPYRSQSTDIVPYDGPVSFGVPTARDRVVSAVLFVCGIALIVASFLNWTVGDVVQTGWERQDGIITIVAGIIGASMAGPIFVGFRHVVPKAVSIVSGVVAVIVLGLVAVNSVLGPTSSGVDFGLGFFIALAGAVFMIIAGASDKGEEIY